MHRGRATRLARCAGQWAWGIANLAAACAPALAQDSPAQGPANRDDAAQAQLGANEAHTLPMTKSVISRGALDKENPQDGYEALKSVAGVTSASAKGTISDNLNIRGIQLDTYSSYRLNGGVSLVNIIAIPSENKERIEALKGANALMFGIASPAGIVNLVTKRATARDISSLALSANAFGQYGGHIDLGRRFGDGKQLGLRVNLAAAHLETGVDGGKGHSQFASVAADWEVTKGLSFKLDLERYSRDVIEQSQVQQIRPVNGVIAVPQVPDATRLLSGPWAHYRPAIDNLQLRADYALSPAWGLLAEAGRSRGERSRFISRINAYSVDTGEGINNITVVQDQRYINTYAKAELAGRFALAGLGHSLTLGLMSAKRDANTPSVTTVRLAQNIYNPRPLPEPVPPNTPITYAPQTAKNLGLYVYDTLAIGQQWKLLAGLRRTHYEAANTLTNTLTNALTNPQPSIQPGGPAAAPSVTTTATHKLSPALGATFQFTPALSVYASFMKGLEETGTAPVGTVNQLNFLPPEEATQKEIGLRAALTPGLLATAAYFDITRANAVTDVKSNVFLIDGTTQFQGLEATLNAELGAWALNLGGLLMKAQQRSLLDLTINGLTPENTPRFSGSASLVYRPAALPGWSVTAGASYGGSRFINPQNQGRIPATTVFSAGLGCAAQILGRKGSLQLNIDNLGNKAYWNSASGGAYGVGMVRNLKLSAKVDL